MNDICRPQNQYRLHESLGYHATVAARLIERRVEDGLRQLGLTRVGWCVLLALSEEGLTSPSEIAQFVGIDRTGISRALRQLESDGLITRAIGRGDRRMTEVQVTDKGHDVLTRAVPVCRENVDHFSSKLTDVEQAELLRLLNKLKAGESPDMMTG